MFLQGTPDVSNALCDLARLLVRGGTLIATVPHPFFWPRYWKYERQEWFDYSRELAVLAPFRISSQRGALGETTHFHRPLSSYTDAIAAAGLSLEQLVEPLPPPALAGALSRPWAFPRFLCLRCRRPRAAAD
jgi:hypothetical protein